MSSRYGSRLLPNVVDQLAREQPDLPYASIPRTTDIKDGFRDISFSAIASATNFVASWIDRNLGRSTSFETIAYIGLADLRYVVVFLAAVKCGYKVLLLSLRNSPWMHVSLLEETSCVHVLHAPEVAHLIDPVLQEKPNLKAHEVAALDDMVRPDTVHYPFDKVYETAKRDPILILHSSGSTGPPKPVGMNHATYAVYDNHRNLPTVAGRVNQSSVLWDFPQKERYFSPFPPFHLGGFYSWIMMPIYYSNATLVIGPPTRPPTGLMVKEIMDQLELKLIFIPPIIAEQLVHEPHGLERCKSLKYLLYGGGPLSQTTGDALSQVTNVCSYYGSTETGPLHLLLPEREDWAYLEWHPTQECIMEPSVDGTYELVMKKNPAFEGIQPLWCNFPDVDVWRTKDLFRPHHTKPNLWKFWGRADDIIVLSNGEKFNPVPIELRIGAHPLLMGALVIGQGYPQASLILEPREHLKERESLVDKVWPTIDKANEEAPAHAKITRDMIMVSVPEKPFNRAGKGTVIRNSSGKKYEKEIARLYAQDSSKNAQHIKLVSGPDLEAVKRFVTKIVAACFPKHEVTEDDDLFVLGLDSLQTTEMILLLKAGIKSSNSNADVSWISARVIYENPSITALSNPIFKHINPEAKAIVNGDSSTPDRGSRMRSIIKKYTNDLPQPQPDKPPRSSSYQVILTGSTGSLGIQILLSLLSNPKTAKVHCLDRSSTARDRITNGLSTWPNPPNLDTTRIAFYQAVYSEPGFGLPEKVLESLRSTVNVIIHNAWKVDFNHSLETFEAVHIRGVRNFIDFAASGVYQPRIIFVSSTSSVGNWNRGGNPEQKNGYRAPNMVLEMIPSTPEVALPMGYAESKAVSEQILASAVEKGAIPAATILRVGQVAGPIGEENGARWNETEWFPLMLKTAKKLGRVPDGAALGMVDWIPVDVLADVVGEIVVGGGEGGLRVLHLTNPVVRAWSELLQVVKKRLGIESVGMEEWVKKLEGVDAGHRGSVEEFPAVKILDFFRSTGGNAYGEGGDVVLDTTEARKESRILRELGPVNGEWLGKWMDGWGL